MYREDARLVDLLEREPLAVRHVLERRADRRAAREHPRRRPECRNCMLRAMFREGKVHRPRRSSGWAWRHTA